MATTNDSAVVDLGRLKAFKSKLLDLLANSIVNAMTSPLPTESSYKHANAEGSSSCALGNNSSAIGNYSMAIGAETAATEEGCVSFGYNARSETQGAVAIGGNSNALAESCTCVGESSAADKNSCTAVGHTAVASGFGGNTAIGANAQVLTGTGSTAIGAIAEVLGDVNNAVALGANSKATDDNTVSVGNDSLKRRFVNVADPVNPTDAATKGYVDAQQMHVVSIAALKSTLTQTQINEIDTNWPNVVISCLADSRSKVVFSPISKTIAVGLPEKASSFVFASARNEIGTSTGGYVVTQLDVNASTGSITPSYGNLHFPAIETNPQFDDSVYVHATGQKSVAIGSGSGAAANLSVALGSSSSTTTDATYSVALGGSSLANKPYQVSVGNPSITRFISHVKDPVDDQDAATRYWTKNADRSDVFSTNHDSAVAGGTGEFYLEANADLNWFAVRGYVSWSSFATAWGNMVRLPGTSDNWWIKTALKVPTAMIPKTNFIAYCSAIDYLGDHSVPYSHDHIAVGTDGYIYVSSWATNHGSTPLGIHCLGHRFYM